MKKLTGPQLELLKFIEESPRYVAEYYPPAKGLVRLGLAEWSGFTGNHLKITDSGKSQLDNSKILP